MSKKAEGFSLRFVLINTGNISRKVLSKVLRSFDKNFERLQLHKVYKRKEQKNTKIADRKLEVAFGAISENGYDLPWHKLEQQKCNERNHKSTGRGEQIGRLYPFVFSCTVVIAGDWL